MRILFWALIVLVVLWLLRTNKPRAKTDAAPRSNAEQERGEAMLQCAHCGVHLPASEALLDPAGRAYCSEEHRSLHR